MTVDIYFLRTIFQNQSTESSDIIADADCSESRQNLQTVCMEKVNGIHFCSAFVKKKNLNYSLLIEIFIVNTIELLQMELILDLRPLSLIRNLPFSYRSHLSNLEKLN